MTTSRQIATIIFDHPPVNALSIPMLHALAEVIEAIASDRELRVLVLRSSVPGMFVAGADLGERRRGNSPTEEFVEALQRAFSGLEGLPMPTIAAIAGHALGGGCELALACDFRIMARGSGRIGLPEVRLGLLAAGGGTQRLLRLVGRAAATDLLLRGRRVDADQAAAIGLVHAAADTSTFEGEVDALAEELRALPPLAVAAAKRVLREGMDLPLDHALALERSAMRALDLTADAEEGVRAFLEKRPGVFSGR